jgi:hypothetical protein
MIVTPFIRFHSIDLQEIHERCERSLDRVVVAFQPCFITRIKVFRQLGKRILHVFV